MIILRKIRQPDPVPAFGTGTIVADTISGTQNNSNKVFYTTYNYKRDRIDFHYNGQTLHSPEDFTESGPNEVTFTEITPYASDNLRATYELSDNEPGQFYRNRTPIPVGVSVYTISLGATFSGTDYNISSDLISSDSDPSVFSYIVANKTTSDFTIFFSGEIDTGNYVLEWIALT